MATYTLQNGFVYQIGGSNEAASNVFDFTGVGCEPKAFTLRDMISKWYNASPGTRLWAILCAMGNSDADIAELELVTSAMAQARAALFINTATGSDLSIIGQNFGIPRPAAAVGDDELYRNLIKALAFGPRGTMRTIYGVVSAFFGPQAEGGWRIFDPGGNKIIIWLKTLVDERSPANASYLHKDATELGEPGNPLTLFPGDYLLSSATYARENSVIKLGSAGSLLAGPSYAGDLIARSTGASDGYAPPHFFSTGAHFVAPWFLATPNTSSQLVITSTGGASPQIICATPSASIAEPLGLPFYFTGIVGVPQAWKLGDIFSDPAGAFSPEDVGGTLNITNSATPANNGARRILAYLSNTQVFIEAGPSPIVTEAGPLTWQIYRGAAGSSFYLTGNQLLQDLQTFLELATTLGVVVIIGNSTT